jgi:hypothetical protein
MSQQETTFGGAISAFGDLQGTVVGLIVGRSGEFRAGSGAVGHTPSGYVVAWSAPVAVGRLPDGTG